MEFIEGAILIVGGIWLVGRMSRKSPAHPTNYLPQLAAASSRAGVDFGQTNTDGSTSLVAGETLLPSPPLILPPVVRVVSPTNSAGYIPVRPLSKAGEGGGVAVPAPGRRGAVTPISGAIGVRPVRFQAL